jgi:hypothetical protein
LNDKLSFVSKHLRSVVPDSIESQYFSIHFYELSQLIEVRFRLVGFQLRHLITLGQIRITWDQFGLVDMQTFALQPFLNESKEEEVLCVAWASPYASEGVTVADAKDFAVDR